MPAKPARTPVSNVAPLRVVIVTLDHHLKGAVARAGQGLAADNITLSLHASSDWDRDPASLQATIADIERADIVIATMLFIDDHVRAILPALTARREHCDAMLGLMSAGEVVKLTRLGGYRMDAPAKGPLALLKRLRGSPKPGASASAGEGQMRMLRRLPKLLRWIPGTAQDVRAYFLTLQYWLAGSDDNVVMMVRALVDRYAAGDRAGRRGATPAAPPADYPELGVYHPALPQRLSASLAALPVRDGHAGTVGLLVLRSYLLGRDTAHYDGVIAAFEAAGLRVIPAFAHGLDARPAIEAFFMANGQPAVDLVVNLTGFSLVGGPAYSDAAAAAAILARLDVPCISAHALEFQSLAQWRDRPQGLLPLETTIMVALPELDGAICPTVFGGRAGESEAPLRAMACDIERTRSLADKARRLVALRRKQRSERRIGIVLFNFPPNAGATGSAAHLAVFESLHATMLRLKASGYSLEVPADVDALRDALLKGNAARFGAEANVAVRIPVDEHVRKEAHLAAIEAAWGPAPGRAQTDGATLHVYGAQFGNVFVGVQPGFGTEGDPVRLLFEQDFAPTHAFAAFYRWLREDFGADALLHFGTHGALEFMPGKQLGLTGQCWPERLVGGVPHFYLYAANNPSEGILAKRRSGATLISYLTPPVTQAGLTRDLGDLKTLLDRRRLATDAEEMAALDVMLADSCAGLDIADADPATLPARLYEIEQTLIPHGLHVLGQIPQGAERSELLSAIAQAAPERAEAETHALLDACDELGAVVHALDGGFVAPAPGGDVLVNPAVLPTGRNLHGFDPFRLPGKFAMAQGTAQAEALLARHAATNQGWPESLAMVLWGADNLKTEGMQIAQALTLMGARPRFDAYGRLCGAELVPLAELGRPRIDVVMTLSGIFRDLLPLQTRMLAEAALLAAEADEPLDQNFVRAHALAHAERLGCDLATAALRVFSNAEGAYGANVNRLIDDGAWTDPDDLANAFEVRKGFAYGVRGEPVQQRAVLQAALGTVEFTYQNLESAETGITDLDQYVDALGGMSRSVARARGGAAAPVYIVDATRSGTARVRTIGEQIDLETRTRTLNPRWYEGQLKHGFEGVRSIENHVTAALGWSATTGEVPAWVYQRVAETFVLDPAMRHRLAALNPASSARVANRLLEACDRQLWTPDAATLAALRDAGDELEDQLEGVVAA